MSHSIRTQKESKQTTPTAVQGVKMNELIVQRLNKLFGAVKAIDNVSFKVEAGKLTTLLGPSGCGKTTTLNCIAGLENPDEGLIRVGDLVLTDTSHNLILPPEARQLGMVFQSYALWPHMTVFDNLKFGLRLKKVAAEEARRRIKEALELVGLGELEQRYPFQLSGGQQQRVALARAIVTQPRLLLLDEPLSNLDAKVREQARGWLREFQERLGITTIYVTHDQSEALAMSDMVAVMSKGKLMQYAPPNEIYERPNSRFVADFIGATAFLEGTVADRTNGGVRVRMKGDQALTVHTDQLWQSGTPVTVAIRSERVQVDGERKQHDNAIAADIHSSLYLGAKWQHTVETVAGEMKVETLDPVQGNKLWLYVPPSAMILLPTETQTSSKE
jgi:iron(III) transport system ATP-binding protein